MNPTLRQARALHALRPAFNWPSFTAQFMRRPFDFEWDAPEFADRPSAEVFNLAERVRADFREAA